MPPFIIITFIVCAIINTIIVKQTGLDYVDAICGYIFSALVTFIMTVIVCGILVCTNPKTYIEETPVATYDIVSLNDNFSSYIGRYYNDNNLRYVTLYKTDKGIANKTIDASSCYINYNEDPYMTKHKVKFSNLILNFLFGDSGTVYFIYIPEGSIIQDSYTIDLE